MIWMFLLAVVLGAGVLQARRVLGRVRPACSGWRKCCSWLSGAFLLSWRRWQWVARRRRVGAEPLRVAAVSSGNGHGMIEA